MRVSTLAASAALVAALAVELYRLRRQIRELERQNERENKLRLSERAGRTAAERKLRQLATSEASGSSQPLSTACTYMPIGRVASCFIERRGTPRQGLLAPAARAMLKLDARAVQPCAALDGLEKFSHVWLLYDFHENTNAAKVSSAQQAPDVGKTAQVKAKVRCPLVSDVTCTVRH